MITATRHLPYSDISILKLTISKDIDGHRYVRLKKGHVTLHKNKASALHDLGTHYARIKGLNDCYPCIVDKKQTVWQGTWDEIKESLKWAK